PDVQTDVSIAGGKVDYIIRDATTLPTPVDPLARRLAVTIHQVDLFIRSTVRGSGVSMFWRLSLPHDSMDSIQRIIPVYYSFAQQTGRPRPADLVPLALRVLQLQQERDLNGPL